MLLTHRLALLLGVTIVVALAAIVVLTDAVYRPLQEAQLESLVQRDLERIAAVAETGSIGRSFLSEDMHGIRVQFVSNDGRVLLPEDEDEPLPLHPRPTTIVDGDNATTLGAVPWRLPSGRQAGTIRVALDAREAIASQRSLRVSLLISGTIIALVGVIVVIVVVRRSLRPLHHLAEMAGEVDVAHPRLMRYEGPDDEVGAVAAALDRALDGIRERQQAERDALAEVAHELAAPLTVVAGHLRGLERREGRTDPRLAAAREAADELLHTSQDLLTLARGELERDPELEVVDLHAKARRVAAEYPGVRTTCEGEDLRVLANPERMRQVVRNLVRNAVQAAGRADGVRVRCRVDGDSVVLEVQDDGPGLGRATQERLFDRYFSGRASAGAGVGLTVARRIVEAHGGTIGVRSTPGEGATFTVALPSFRSQMALDDDPLVADPEGGDAGVAASLER